MSIEFAAVDKVIDALFQIQGGYALVMMTQNTLIGVRDPYGIRPLVIGKLSNSYVLASETCAFDIIGAKFVREVENNELSEFETYQVITSLAELELGPAEVDVGIIAAAYLYDDKKSADNFGTIY